MKNKKLILTLLVLFVFSLFTGLVAAQDEPTLTIWADERRTEPIQALGDQFAEENDIAVDVVELPFAEIRDQFKTAAPAGEGPDIIIGAHDWLGELVVNGLLEPVDLGEKADVFTESAVSAFVYEGDLYGMPYATENVALFRNTDLVPDVPATWDEVREISAALVESGEVEYGWVIQENDPFHFFPVQTAFGGYVFGLTEDGYDPTDVGIDSEGSIAAAEYLDAYIEAGLMPSGLDVDGMRSLFESGDAAMVISGPWDVSRFTDAGVPFEVSVLPGQGDIAQGSPFLGVQGFMISSFSDNTLLANLFLTEYMATDDAMQAIFDSGDRPSAYIPVLEATESDVLAAFGEAGTTGLAMPAIPEMASVWSAWGDALELVMQDQVDAEEAFTNAATQIRQAIGLEE